MNSDAIEVEVKNVGGIESDSIIIERGVTILSGENATNRTSLIKSIKAGLGSDDPPIRSGTNSGYVNIKIDDEKYERTVTATQNGFYWDGDGVVEDIEPLQLFSFLLEDNEVRQAVAGGENLYDVVMRPVDTTEIERKIDNLKERRAQISEEDSKLSDKKKEVTRLENANADKKERINELEKELEKIKYKLNSVNKRDIKSGKVSKSKKFNQELKKKNKKINNLKDKISYLKERISMREDRMNELYPSTGDNTKELNKKLSEINDEIEQLERRLSLLEEDKRNLSPLRRFLSQITKEQGSLSQINKVVEKHSSTDTSGISSTDERCLTDALVKPDTLSQCILCGGKIEDGQYEQLFVEVNNIISNIRSKIDDIESKISQLRSDKSNINDKINTIKSNQNEIKTINNTISELKDDLKEHEHELEQAKADQRKIKKEIDDLERETIEESEDKISELRSLESEKTEIEIEMQNLENSIESNQCEINSLEEDIDEIEDLIETKPKIDDRLDELRGKVGSIESSIVERFNKQMEEIIESLSYEGIERIWIEKKQKEVREGRKKIEKPFFNLNIVREINGKTTTDVVTNLSESEREVTGMVLALTGYIVHDVTAEFPMVMIDSVEMIDATRLEALLEYIDKHVKYLIVAALPEDTETMDIGSVIEK